LANEHVGAARMQAADRGMLIDRALAIGDAIDNDAIVVRQAGPVSASELPIRAFVVNPPFTSDDAPFQNNFGVGRHGEIVGLALHKLRRLAIEAAENVVVVHTGEAEHGCNLVDRRATDYDGDRHVLAEFLIP
jgi:hypothetical protein